MTERSINDVLFQRLVAAAAPHSVEITLDTVTAAKGGATQQRLSYGYSTPSYWQPEYYLGPLTDEVLTDLAAYFENRPIDKETIMNIYSTDLFTYMAGDMIGQSTITLTIATVTMEKMNSGKGGAQSKPCLHFKERDKLMVLNKTNAKFLAGELGPETDNWTGARVTIAAPVVDAFGKSQRSLRVIKVEQELVPVKTRNGNPNAPAAQSDLFNGAASDDAAQQAALATAQGQMN